MKKYICLSLLIIFALSCENDTTPLDVENFFIQEIISSHENDDYVQRDDFSYDVNGRLISVTRDLSYDIDLVGNREIVEFQYEGDRLISKTHRYNSTDTLHRQVSYTYLPNGRLYQASHAYPYTGVMEVQWVDTYEYNTDGTLRKQTSVNPNSTDTGSSNQFYWKNGNVSKIETYYNSQLHYESYFTYDNATNYRKGNPFFHDYEISLATRNNIKKVRYEDYSGFLDLACNPCSYSYEYNDLNLPTKVTGPLPFGKTQSIFYEIPIDEIK